MKVKLMNWLLCCLLLLIHSPIFSNVRIVPVDGTTEAEAIDLKIIFPKNESIQDKKRVEMRVSLTNYPLGIQTQTNRQREIYNYRYGQSIHFVVDNHPYFVTTGPSIDVFNQDGNFREQYYKVLIPFPLEAGVHTIRAFVCRSYGESLKGEKCFVARNFFYRKKDTSKAPDLDKPYLTFNEPNDLMVLPKEKPVFLDFYVTNTELSKDGYQVRLSIDEDTDEYLTEWRPYYLYGFAKGKHKITLELVDKNKDPVEGPFNSVTRTIFID